MRYPRRKFLSLLGAILLPLLAARESAGAETPPEPTGYRTSDYGAPTPQTLKGATVITTAEAARLWRQKDAIFVDVLPQAPRPAGLAQGTIWNRPPHRDIPGSIWLPDTGYGRLAAPMREYMRQGLSRATNGNRNRLLVFYCKPRCWMSWNAAKRALALGYTHVAWYPGGAPDWEKAGLPLQICEPEPRPE